MSEGRRQPTPSPSQEGKTGDRRKGNERGGRSKNCFLMFLPNYEPKIRSMYEHEKLKQAQFF